jgi:hypothetical protein
MPPSWYEDSNTRVPELYGWRQIYANQAIARLNGGEQRPTAVYNGRVFLGGESEVEVYFDPLPATGILLKIDAVINHEHRDSNSKNHLPDHTDAVIAEFEVLSTPGDARVSSKHDALNTGSAVGGDGEPVTDANTEEETLEGLDLRALLASFNTASWNYSRSTSTSGQARDTTSQCDPSAEWRPIVSIGNVRAGGAAGAVEEAIILGSGSSGSISAGGGAGGSGDFKEDILWGERVRDVADICKDLSGVEILFMGDARMRHAMLATGMREREKTERKREKERERERERETETERETVRQRETETETAIEREREREREKLGQLRSSCCYSLWLLFTAA